MAKMRLSHENTKNLSPDIHQLCQYLAYLAYLARLAGIWQESGRIKKRLLLRFSCCGLLSNHYLCGNQKQDHHG